MRIAVTGPDGFVAWHTRCAARARWGHDLIGVGRAELGDPQALAECLSGADAVIHLAAINRSADESGLVEQNVDSTVRLMDAIERTGRPITVIHGNSIHHLDESAFGESKRQSAEVLRSGCQRIGSALVDVVLPNLFGEHGRPNYNSVVATFCHQIAHGDRPRVYDDRELPLLHVQDAATLLLDQASAPTPGVVGVEGRPTLISEVAERLSDMALGYRSAELPDLSDEFTRDLFNTYRSHLFPGGYPLQLQAHGDRRGDLVEAVRVWGGQGQVFYSTTVPGQTRGQHFHLRKVERFLVVSGTAEIRLRRLFSDEMVRFEVAGDAPAVVDMPTLWSHSITNTGNTDLLTLFWANEVFDPDRPDTYAEVVA